MAERYLRVGVERSDDDIAVLESLMPRCWLCDEGLGFEPPEAVYLLHIDGREVSNALWLCRIECLLEKRVRVHSPDLTRLVAACGMALDSLDDTWNATYEHEAVRCALIAKALNVGHTLKQGAEAKWPAHAHRHHLDDFHRRRIYG